jgi:hypothetical protein
MSYCSYNFYKSLIFVAEVLKLRIIYYELSFFKQQMEGKFPVSFQLHNLSFHMNTHAEAKPYECPVCAKGFCRSFDLKKHARKLHSSALPPAALAADQLSDSDSPLPSPVCVL